MIHLIQQFEVCHLQVIQHEHTIQQIDLVHFKYQIDLIILLCELLHLIIIQHDQEIQHFDIIHFKQIVHELEIQQIDLILDIMEELFSLEIIIPFSDIVQHIHLDLLQIQLQSERM